MVKQKSLHLKLDSSLLDRLDFITSTTGINRNKLINKAVEFVVSSCELQLEVSKSVHFFDYDD